MMNNKKNDYKILLEHYDGIIDRDINLQFISRLKKMNMDLVMRDQSNVITNSIEDFSNLVSLSLNNSLVQACIKGMITSGSYDLLKLYIIWLWNSIRGKCITRMFAGEKTEQKEVTFGVHINIDENNSINFRLEGDASDELKSKCIDKIFKLLENTSKKSKSYTLPDLAKYDWESDEWRLIDVMEEIQKKMIKENTDIS